MRGSYLFTYLTIGLLFVTALLPVLHTVVSRRKDYFDPINWSGLLLFVIVGVPALRRVISRDYRFYGEFTQQAPSNVIIQMVVVATILALLCLYAGYYLSAGKKIARRLPRYSTSWSSEKAWSVIIVFLFVGYVGYFLLSGMISTGPRSQLADGFSKYAFIAVNLLNTASILAVSDLLMDIKYYDYKFEIQEYTKIIYVSLIVISNAALLLNLGGRGRAFSIFIISIFLAHYLVKNTSIYGPALAFSLLYTISSWVAEIMGSLLSLNIVGAVDTILSPYLFRDTPRIQFNQLFIVFSSVPEELSFQYGQTFLSAMFALFPFQPVPQTQTVYNRAFAPSAGTDYGVPITLIGELYLNFWIPGIIVGFFICGVFIRVFYEWCIGLSRNIGGIILFSAVTNNFLLIGNFSNSAPTLGLKLIPLLLAILYISGGLLRSSGASDAGSYYA